MDYDDIQNATEEQLRRLLEFALKNDASGPRMSKDPPKNRREIIEQLTWLGVLHIPNAGGWYR